MAAYGRVWYCTFCNHTVWKGACRSLASHRTKRLAFAPTGRHRGSAPLQPLTQIALTEWVVNRTEPLTLKLKSRKWVPLLGLPTHWSGQLAKAMSSVARLNYGSQAELVMEHLPLRVSRKTRAEFSSVVSISRLTELKACWQVVMVIVSEQINH